MPRQSAPKKAVAEAEEARKEADLATRRGILQAANQIEDVVTRIAASTEAWRRSPSRFPMPQTSSASA